MLGILKWLWGVLFVRLAGYCCVYGGGVDGWKKFSATAGGVPEPQGWVASVSGGMHVTSEI